MILLLPHFQMVPITKKDYLEAMKAVVDGGWSGAKIYDALTLGCAARSGAERIYTFNLSDFQQLAPNLKERICAPRSRHTWSRDPKWRRRHFAIRTGCRGHPLAKEA